MRSAHVDLGGPQSLAAHVVLRLTRNVTFAKGGELKQYLKLRFLLGPSHERVPGRAAETLSIVEVPLDVDNLCPSVHYYGLAYVESVGPGADAFVANLDSGRLHKRQEV